MEKPIKPKAEDCKGLMDWSYQMMVYKIRLLKWLDTQKLNHIDKK